MSILLCAVAALAPRRQQTLSVEAQPSNLTTPIRWLHIPKTGSSFVVAIYRYACPSVATDELVTLLEDDCMGPCLTVTVPYPPETYCTGLTSNASDADGSGTVLDEHFPPVYPRDTGHVVSLFRQQYDIKISLLNFAHELANDSYVESCGGSERDAPNWMKAIFRNMLPQTPEGTAVADELSTLAREVFAPNASNELDSATLDDMRCTFLTGLLPRLQGAQTRMAFGDFFLAINASLNATQPPLPTDTAAVESVLDNFAFVGTTERFNESVCAFHLALGGSPPSVDELLVHGRKSTPSGIDWPAEAERCGLPTYLIDDTDPDAEIYRLVDARLDATIADLEVDMPGAMQACLSGSG